MGATEGGSVGSRRRAESRSTTAAATRLAGDVCQGPSSNWRRARCCTERCWSFAATYSGCRGHADQGLEGKGGVTNPSDAGWEMGRANTSRIPYTGFAGTKPDGNKREPMVLEERQHGSCAGWCSGNLNVFLPRPIATCTSTIFYGATVLFGRRTSAKACCASRFCT